MNPSALAFLRWKVLRRRAVRKQHGNRAELVNDVGEDFVHFRLCKTLLRAGTPILKLAGHEIFIAFHGLVERKLIRPPFAEAQSASFAAIRTSQV